MGKKYKISINDLEKSGNANKLEKDGFSKGKIHKAMYEQTRGADKRTQEEIISRLYKRER